MIVPESLILMESFKMTMFTRAATALILAISAFLASNAFAQEYATNPILYADVPDVSLLRVGDDYYMSSTTNHMAPGVPIMHSKNLVDWNIIGYAYDVLEVNDKQELRAGKNAYGDGSWASSLRYHDGVFYLVTFSQTTGKTHVYTTRDPAGKWESLEDKQIFDGGKFVTVPAPLDVMPVFRRV